MVLLKIMGVAFVSLLGLVLIYLIRVIFLPFRKIKPISMVRANPIEEKEPSPYRRKISFAVDGTTVRGWLYIPEDAPKPVGCIVMNNGFGGTVGMVLEKYALRFREAGYGVLCYDFRCFGLSEGLPRQNYDMNGQLQDLSAAIEYARAQEEIDPEKIAVWGTSGAGGYGLIRSARRKDIACAIGQCPALDKGADSKLMLERQGLGTILRLLMHAQRDKGRSRFGLSPHKIPIAGRTGEFAFFSDDVTFDGYSRLVSPTFANEICARVLLDTNSLNPIDFASHVSCPVLIMSCEKDHLVTASSHENAAGLIGKLATLRKYPCGHFDIYEDPYFESGIKDQISFLDEHLK